MQYFTALDLATVKNNGEIVKYLRLNGATDANRLTRTSAIRIQRVFLKQRSNRSPLPSPKDVALSAKPNPNIDPNGVLEEAFETGIRSPQGIVLSASSASPQQEPEEISAYETDSSTLPNLPSEISSSPTVISSLIGEQKFNFFFE